MNNRLFPFVAYLKQKRAVEHRCMTQIISL